MSPGVTYSIGVVKSAQRACSGNQNKLSEGQIQQWDLGKNEWTLAVHSVKRRLNGQGRATFSLRPSVPQISSLTQVATSATSD